jgi:hypothetical protein
MKITFIKYLFIIGTLLINGCAQKKPDSIVINNLSSSKNIKILGPSTQYINDILEVSIEIENLSQTSYNDIEYRFKWYNQEKYEVGENLSIWKPLFLEPLDSKKVTSLAPTPKAERFKFYIKESVAGKQVKRVDSNSIQSEHLYYGAEELHLFTEKMVSSMLSSEIFDGKVVIDIGDVKNKTDEYIDTSSITNSIKTTIIKSKRARFIDSSKRETINRELEYQNSSKYIDKSSSKKIGKQIAPNYILDGSVFTIKQKSDHFYKITLKLHNLETGTIDWIEQKEVRKVNSK